MNPGPFTDSDFESNTVTSKINPSLFTNLGFGFSSKS